jgi:hypothetical protein
VTVGDVPLEGEVQTGPGQSVRCSGLFDVAESVVVPWIREVTMERWLIEHKSKSYIAALPDPDRQSLPQQVERVTSDRFPTGKMQVLYQTRLWTASKI